MSKLKVGIISANSGAVADLQAWRAVLGVEVVGICTSRRETAEAAARKLWIERAFLERGRNGRQPRRRHRRLWHSAERTVRDGAGGGAG